MGKKIFSIATILVLGFLLTASPILAQGGFLSRIGIPGGQLIPVECTGPADDVNDCGLNQILQTVVNFTQLLFGLAGSLALLVFLYGGVMWIISAGKAEMVEKGKQAITAAVIGLLIMLGSWLIVNMTISALTNGQVGATGNIFGTPWFQTQKIQSPGSGAAPAQTTTQPETTDPAKPPAPDVEPQPAPEASAPEYKCELNYNGDPVTYDQALAICQNNCAETCPGCKCSVLIATQANEIGEPTSNNFSCYCSNIF